ncbi:hypothetical protein [Micromonospora sp. SL4-19]|uniref:hypothetical protein n=1 Tax=Micromonospora sp. SL4-19 TaxID=3399129 RepID=UPI003A4D557C
MLPIALTCPVWWVARWAARVFASLAVVVACSLGAATLPVASAVAAPAAPRTAAGPVDTSALRAGHLVAPGADPALRAVIHWSDRAADPVGQRSPSPEPPTGAGSAGAATGSAERIGPRASHTGAAGTGERQVVPVGAPDPVAQRGVVVVPVDRLRVLVGLLPATVGSRAPPAR